jgi:hypothetical protein
VDLSRGYVCAMFHKHFSPTFLVGMFAQCSVGMSCEPFLWVYLAPCVVNISCGPSLWAFVAPCFVDISCEHLLRAFVAPCFVSSSCGPFHGMFAPCVVNIACQHFPRVCSRHVSCTSRANIPRGYVCAIGVEYSLSNDPNLFQSGTARRGPVLTPSIASARAGHVLLLNFGDPIFLV